MLKNHKYFDLDCFFLQIRWDRYINDSIYFLLGYWKDLENTKVVKYK